MNQNLDDDLTRGVMLRRAVAWLIDLIVIALLIGVCHRIFWLFGFRTVVFNGWEIPAVSVVPFCYNVLSLLTGGSATPAQRLMGLTMRRNDDLGPPTFIEAMITTIVYYLTLATSGLLLLVALFTRRHRTLHDLLSGLVVVRRRAIQSRPLTQGAEPWTMYHGSFDRQA
jgi:uncharacterized RDD family membrane protein YckC